MPFYIISQLSFSVIFQFLAFLRLTNGKFKPTIVSNRFIFVALITAKLLIINLVGEFKFDGPKNEYTTQTHPKGC